MVRFSSLKPHPMSEIAGGPHALASACVMQHHLLDLVRTIDNSFFSLEVVWKIPWDVEVDSC